MEPHEYSETCSCKRCYDRRRYLNGPKKERTYARRAAQKEGKDNKYHCGCGCYTFRFEPRKERGSFGGTVVSNVLVCTACNKPHHIEPCNTNGLNRDLPVKGDVTRETPEDEGRY